MSASTAAARRKPVDINKGNVTEFLRQVDYIVSDCDGVIWHPGGGIVPNARPGLESLRASGKKLMFVTNNSLRSPLEKFARLGFSIEKENVADPAVAIARYLQQQGFKKTAFVLASDRFKDELRAAGIKVLPENTVGRPEEPILNILTLIEEDPEIGAVVTDNDLHLKYLDLVRAANFLLNPDCQFITGATERKLAVDGKVLIGAGYFTSILEDISRRKPVVFGKPSPTMVSNFLREVHNLDMKRAVFVGDALPTDMGIANACGMKKLLVLSGVTQRKDLETCDPAHIPDFVIDSVADFATLLQ